MEQLPARIEELLDELPTIPFSDSLEFQQILLSPLFQEIFDYYMSQYATDKIKAQADIYQRTSLYLSLTNQDESFLEKTDSVLYARPFPTIDEFLDNTFFMGHMSGKFYPYWQDALRNKIFHQGSAVKKVILTGSTGSGKTTIAMASMIYALLRILYLRHPRSVFNILEGATLAAFVLSVNFKQAEQTILQPFMELLGAMPCFKRVLNINAFEQYNINDPKCPTPFYLEKSSLTIRFPRNIIFTVGSGISNTVGYNAVITGVDECNEKGADEAIALISSIDGRLTSRFKGSDFTFQTVISSSRQKSSPTELYIKQLPKNDPSILIFRPMRFEVKNTADFIGDGRVFPVLVGNGIIPGKIITDPIELKQVEDGTYIPPVGCQLVPNVPESERTQFELQFDQSVQDILGLTTNANEIVFRDISKLEDDLLCPEITLEVNMGQTERLIDQLPPELFATSPTGKKVFKRAPNALRHIHFDLSQGSQSDGAICFLHKETMIDHTENGPLSTICFVVDMIIRLTSKTKIDLEVVKNLPIDLVKECGMVVHTLSTDQWQCLEGGTGIRLLDGTTDTIANITTRVNKGEVLYTYSLDTVNHKLIPGKIIAAAKTGKKNILEVVLDNGGIVRCTPEHPFMLRDGCFCCAKDLHVGDSLMPLYTKIDRHGYELFFDPFDSIYKPTYKSISKRVNGTPPKGYHIHHIDFNKSNNNPTNLYPLSRRDHCKIHAETTRKSFDANGGQRRKDQAKRIMLINKTGRRGPNIDNTTPEARARCSCYNKLTWTRPGYREKMKHRYPGSASYLIHLFGKSFKTNPNIDPADVSLAKKQHRIKWEKEHKCLVNHKVRSIKYTQKKEFVYDIQIDGEFHNFALTSGVFVHNSVLFRTQLENSKCFKNVIELSVDKTLDPYMNCAAMVEKGRVKIGRCPRLKKELESLIIEKNKVTKTTTYKDLSDTLAGAVWTATNNHKDYPQYVYVRKEDEKAPVSYSDYIEKDEILAQV